MQFIHLTYISLAFLIIPCINLSNVTPIYGQTIVPLEFARGNQSRPTFRFGSAARCVQRDDSHAVVISHGSLSRRRDTENRFHGAKKSTSRSLVFREARAAYRVRALCARPTYLLGARITVNNGHCTFCRVDRTNRRVHEEIGENAESCLSPIFNENKE